MAKKKEVKLLRNTTALVAIQTKDAPHFTILTFVCEHAKQTSDNSFEVNGMKVTTTGEIKEFRGA